MRIDQTRDVVPKVAQGLSYSQKWVDITPGTVCSDEYSHVFLLLEKTILINQKITEGAKKS